MKLSIVKIDDNNYRVDTKVAEELERLDAQINDLRATVHRLRQQIPYCDCAKYGGDSRQCWEPCGDLGRSEAHAEVAPEAEKPKP